MAMSIILIILFCYALGLKPLRLLLKIGKGFFTLIGLWIILKNQKYTDRCKRLPS